MSGDFKNCHFGKQEVRSERSALIGWGAARFKLVLEDMEMEE
jgi:hypothetical protein